MARLPNQRNQLIDSLYTESNNTLVSRRQDWITEIGDASVTNAFLPHVKVKKWADCDFSIEFLHNLPGQDSVNYADNVISWSKGGYELRIYDTTQGYNIDAVIPSRPPIDSISYVVSRNNVELRYQGNLTLAQTVRGAMRPENVVGSYAVYRADGYKHGIYQTGKLAHIYRPLLTDALGNTSWATLSFNDATGVMTITADSVWLDNAAYPVTVDPDIGYTTAGASWFSIEAIALGAEGTTTGTGGTLNSVSAYVRETFANNTHLYRGAVYSNNTTGATLIEQTGTQQTATTTAGWVTISGMSASVSASTTYRVLMGAGGGGGALELAYDDNAASSNPTLATFDPTTGYSNPANLGDTTEDYSVYFTYTESGGFQSAWAVNRNNLI